jgi:hypothetical protein
VTDDAGSSKDPRGSGIYALYRGKWYPERGSSDDSVLLGMASEELAAFASDDEAERRDRGADSWVKVPRAAVERLVRVNVSADWRDVTVRVHRFVDGRAVILMHRKPERVDDVQLGGSPYETGGWYTTVPVSDLFDVREEVRDLALSRELGLLDTVAEELMSMGLGEDVDFYIPGRREGAWPSSEHIGMGFRDGVFRVWYKDLALKKELLLTPDFAAARKLFVDEATSLAAGRGRGPKVPGYDHARVAAKLAEATRAQELIDSLAEELATLGMADSSCFYLSGHGELLRPGLDFAGMAFRGGAFHVWRKTRSARQELLVSMDFEEARKFFLEEGASLAVRRGLGVAEGPASSTREGAGQDQVRPTARRRGWRAWRKRGGR